MMMAPTPISGCSGNSRCMVRGIIAGCSSAIGAASKFTLRRIGIQVRPKLLCLAQIGIKFEHTLHVGARLRRLARYTESNAEIEPDRTLVWRTPKRLLPMSNGLAEISRP